MTSEIQTELRENFKQMKELMNKQSFTIGDAEKYAERNFNVIRMFEDLESSRNNWKRKCLELHEQIKILKEKWR